MNRIFTLGILTAFALSACMTLDLKTAYQLSKLGPLDVDAQSARVAVIWPDDIIFDEPRVQFTATKDGKEVRDDSFILIVDKAGKPTLDLTAKQIGKDITVYKLSSDDLPRALSVQALAETMQADEAKRSGPDWDGESSAFFKFKPSETSIADYCARRTKWPISVWVKTDAKSVYKRLVNAKPLEKILPLKMKALCKKRKAG